MVVQTYEITPGHAGLMGLDVGASNVREHFPRDTAAVELELDHLCIVCSLAPSFWMDRPEIHDARLSLWLEAKRMGGKLSGAPAPLAMIPSGPHAFRLEVIARDAADYALTGPSGPVMGLDGPTAVVTQILTPVVAFDRRKRGVARDPDRRIGKLKDNDSPTPRASH